MPAAIERELWVIVNPRAGRRVALVKLAAALTALEERGWRVRRYRTGGPMGGQRIAARAAAAGVDAVLVCGGDGTINEAVNGLAGGRTALAVLPAGTVNIWARETGLSSDPQAAVRLVEAGSRRRVDLGRTGDRRFLLFASVGADSTAVRAVSETAKRRWGRWALIAKGVQAFAREGGEELTIESPSGKERGRFVALVVGNTQLYGGAMRATAAARIDDGLLDLCGLRGRGWRALGMHVARILAGRHIGNSSTLYLQAPWFRILAAEPVAVQADGENVSSTPVEVRIEPASLTVIVPAGLDTSLLGLFGKKSGRRVEAGE